MYASPRPVTVALVPVCLLAFACTPGEDGSTTTTIGDDFVIEDDDDNDDDVDADDTESGEDDATDTTGDGDTTDATTTDTDADADTTDADTNDDMPNPCGNGLIDPGEDCDGGSLGGATCVSEGFDSGVLDCNADCTFDTSGCQNDGDLCGNGIIDVGEQCDGANLDGFSCEDLGFPAGQLSCDPVVCWFDTDGCGGGGGASSEDFEGGAMPFGWTTGGNANWTITSVDKHAGTYGIKAGEINLSQTSWVQVVVQFQNAGSISFWHKISSESGYDFGYFTIDGVQQDEWSGLGNWVQFNAPVGAGMHTFRWTYGKDDSIDAGLDTWYLDDVTVVGGTLP